MGGADDDDKTFNDGLWILNVNDIHWTKVFLCIVCQLSIE